MFDFDEVRPCPFCGHKAVLIAQEIGPLDTIYHVECPNCEIQTKESYYKDDALAVWNERISDSEG